MDIWNKLLIEQTRAISTSTEIAWSYTKGEFISHESMDSLSSTDFSAAIIRKDIEFDSMNDSSGYNRIEHGAFYLITDEKIDKEVLFFIKNYWTLIMKVKCKKSDNPFIFVHMASSLDGKIATNCGNSKWIGNQENLTHAHRLRAIFDGIMVGANTVKKDSPKLNVRHVEGINPIRLILSNSCFDFDQLERLNDADTYLLRNRASEKIGTSFPFEKKVYFTGSNKREELHNLLVSLKDLGINSILIEGGPKTVSGFLEAGLVDSFQLHMAPLILGSGRDFVKLDEISEIGEGLTMNDAFYTPMGDSIMITGNL